MGEHNILYQIKTLEKMIFRTFCNDKCFQPQFHSQDAKTIPTPTQMQIIQYILEHIDEDIYQKDLEKILNLRRATVSGVLQTMEKNNLIERFTDSEDSRAKRIIINEEARKIFLKNKQKINELEEIVTFGISKSDLEIFSNVIEAMKKNVEKINS